MYYVNVSREQIEDLRPVIDLLTQIWGEDLDENALYLYGMVDDTSPVIPIMTDETDSTVSAGVVAIPLNTDALYYLTGSGYVLKREQFLYASDNELRTANFGDADQEAIVTLSSFTRLALSNSDAWMDRYFKLENPEAISSPSPHGEVDRTEKATDPLIEKEHGGLKSEEPAVVKSSAMTAGKIIKTWAETNIENWSYEELYQLLHKLHDSQSDKAEVTFFLWSASDESGYLMEIWGGTGAAVRYISSKLGLDFQEVEDEGTVLTGIELANAIESLLGA